MELTNALNIFKNYTIKTPRFTLNGLKTYGRVVDVIDGDSLTIILPVYNDYYKFNVRLNGIDASELHSQDDQLKQNALNARNTILNLIMGEDMILKEQHNFTKIEIQDMLEKQPKLVWIECLEFDKYGRLLAEIYITKDKDSSLSEYLLEKHLVYKYYGGKKLTENDQLEEFKK